jgi:hypothetical protein
MKIWINLVAIIMMVTSAGASQPQLVKIFEAVDHVLASKPLPMDCNPEVAAEFMVEVAIVESAQLRSGQIHFVVDGNGYDFGPFQINLSTAMDVLSKANAEEIHTITGYMHTGCRTTLKSELIDNYILGAYVFREKFGQLSFREKGVRSKVWTERGTLEYRAMWWKQHYNTSLGAGTVEHYIRRVNYFQSI